MSHKKIFFVRTAIPRPNPSNRYGNRGSSARTVQRHQLHSSAQHSAGATFAAQGRLSANVVVTEYQPASTRLYEWAAQQVRSGLDQLWHRFKFQSLALETSRPESLRRTVIPRANALSAAFNRDKRLWMHFAKQKVGRQSRRTSARILNSPSQSGVQWIRAYTSVISPKKRLQHIASKQSQTRTPHGALRTVMTRGTHSDEVDNRDLNIQELERYFPEVFATQLKTQTFPDVASEVSRSRDLSESAVRRNEMREDGEFSALADQQRRVPAVSEVSEVPHATSGPMHFSGVGESGLSDFSLLDDALHSPPESLEIPNEASIPFTPILAGSFFSARHGDLQAATL